jgi:hypothetical protein
VHRLTEIEPLAGIDPIDYFNEAQIIARIFERRGYDDIPDYFGPRLKSLSQRAYELEGLQVTYSGTGIGAVRDPGDDLVSIYGDFENRTGIFRGLGLAVFDELGCVELSEEVSDISNADLIAYSYKTDDIDRVKRYIESVKEPPSGFRLVADFIIEQQDGELGVRGHSVRTKNGILLIDTIDLSSIDIFNLDTPPDEPGAEIWHLEPVLEYFHDNYRRLLRDPVFRNLHIDSQKKELDKRLEQLNSTLGLHRFKVKTKPSFVYVPEVARDSSTSFVQIATPEFNGHALRADCVELQHVVNSGERITSRKGNVDSNNSVCVVVEIDEVTKRKIGTDSAILWAPVFGEGIGRRLEKSIRKNQKSALNRDTDDELNVQFYERAILD